MAAEDGSESVEEESESNEAHLEWRGNRATHNKLWGLEMSLEHLLCKLYEQGRDRVGL